MYTILVHFYKTLNITSELLMMPTGYKTRNMANTSTVRKHEDIVPHVLSLHTLTGFDTVSSIYSVGKVVAVKALQKGHLPSQLSNDELYGS